MLADVGDAGNADDARRPAGLLASNLAVIGFIYFRTHDEAAATVHQQVVEQGSPCDLSFRRQGRYDAITTQ
jgi:hypothetical protein